MLSDIGQVLKCFDLMVSGEICSHKMVESFSTHSGVSVKPFFKKKNVYCVVYQVDLSHYLTLCVLCVMC